VSTSNPIEAPLGTSFRGRPVVQRLVLEPQWLPASQCKTLYSLSRQELNRIEADGFIRAAKEGDANHTKRYCCRDIDAYLVARAAGVKPKVVRGKA
jgi:hypothetical protein